MNKLLTIDNVINNLSLSDKSDIETFVCSRFSRQGFLVFTSDKMIFVYYSDKEEFCSEEFIFPLFKSIDVAMSGNKGYIEIKYGHLKLKFSFSYLNELRELINLLEKKFETIVKNVNYREGEIQKNILSSQKTPKTDLKDSIDILHKNVSVGDKFLHIASSSVLNYQDNIIKPKELKDESNELKTHNTKTKNEKVLEKNIQKNFIIDNPQKLNKKEKIDAFHKNVKVSEKFLSVASSNIPEKKKAVSVPYKTKRFFKNLVINIIYLLIIVGFFKSDYSKEVRSWLYYLPQNLSYGLNFIQAQRCELELMSMGKIVIYYYHTHDKTFPPDFVKFMRGSFEKGLKTDSAKDPWGNFYEIEIKSNNFFVIRSFGPDKKRNTQDDLFNTFSLSYTPDVQE